MKKKNKPLKRKAKKKKRKVNNSLKGTEGVVFMVRSFTENTLGRYSDGLVEFLNSGHGDGEYRVDKSVSMRIFEFSPQQKKNIEDEIGRTDMVIGVFENFIRTIK